MNSHEILERFSFFWQLPIPLQAEVEAHASHISAPPGAVVFRAGQICDKVIFAGRGRVRVFAHGDTGRELTLYQVGPGEACILNVSCLVAGAPYPAHAVAAEQAEAVAVSPDTFRDWMEKLPTVRTFVFNMMASRLVGLMLKIEEITLQRMDRRLSSFLLAESRARGETLPLTHESIASELGSAREVISRLLKELEGQGIVRLARGRIQLTNRAALAEIAGTKENGHG